MNKSSYFKQFEQHPGEQGWYVYLRPSDPRCRAIRERGPIKEEDAENLVARLNGSFDQ